MALQLAASGSLLRISGTPDNLAAHVNCCCPGPCACDPHSGAPFTSITILISGITCCIHTGEPSYCVFACPDCTEYGGSFVLAYESSICRYEYNGPDLDQKCAYNSIDGCENAEDHYHMRIRAWLNGAGMGWGAVWVDFVADSGQIRLWTANSPGTDDFCYVNDIVTNTLPLAYCPNDGDRDHFIGWGGQAQLTAVTP